MLECVGSILAGCLPLCKWLTTQTKKRPDTNVLALAAMKAGDVAALDWIMSRRKQKKFIVKTLLKDMFYIPSIPVLEWLERHVEESYVQEFFVYVGLAASYAGSIRTLEWLKRAQGLVIYESYLTAAAKGGHFQLLKWLREHSAIGMSLSTVEAAFMSGNLELVKWVVERYGHEVDYSEVVPECIMSTKEGSVEVMRWLIREKGVRIGSWLVSLCKTREMIRCVLTEAGEAMMKIIPYVTYRELEKFLEAGCPWEERYAEEVAKRGNTELLNWIVTQGHAWNAERCLAATPVENTDMRELIHRLGGLVR